MSIILLSIGFVVCVVLNIVHFVLTHKKIESMYVNIYNLSKGLDMLYENQQKILELTKVKSFVQLTTEEEKTVLKNITHEQKIKKIHKTEVKPEDTEQAEVEGAV